MILLTGGVLVTVGEMREITVLCHGLQYCYMTLVDFNVDMLQLSTQNNIGDK